MFSDRRSRSIERRYNWRFLGYDMLRIDSLISGSERQMFATLRASYSSVARDTGVAAGPTPSKQTLTKQACI